MAEKVDDVFSNLQRKMREGSYFKPNRNTTLGLNHTVKIKVSTFLSEKQFEIPYSEYCALIEKLEAIHKANTYPPKK